MEKRIATVLSLTLIALFVTGSLTTGQAVAQTTGSISIPDLLSIRPDNKQDVLRSAEKATAMDSPLNPKDYYVGPNDVLALNIWSSAPVQLQLTVSPEGTLLIPNIGALSIRGLSLDIVKERVAEAAKKKYPNSDISLTLISPRRVAVKIIGQVLNEGPMEMSSVQRAHQLIAEANQLKTGQIVPDYYERVLPQLRAVASQRNIQVRHQEGSIERVDLVRYELTGDGKYNPYLREGDVVFVPSRSDLSRSLGVFGAANLQGSVEYVSGDSLSALIAIGYGFSPQADSTRILLTRLSFDGATMDSLHVDGAAIRAHRQPDIAMHPGDRIVIPEVPELRQNYFVSLEGALRQTGFFPITLNTTKLSHVVRAAGGFTSDARVRGALVIRTRASRLSGPQEVERELMLSQRANLSIEDTTYYHIETALRAQEEIVTVDFEKLFVKGDSTQDVILHNYDRIVVPTRRYSIYVFGQVVTPGHVPYIEGKSHRYYVEKAGGFASDARSSDVKVIKGNTRAWLDPSETTIEDGDYIWVPREVHRPFSYYITTYAQIASIIGVVATVALLINTIK